MKFYGPVGFVEVSQKRAGVIVQNPIEYVYSGDVLCVLSRFGKNEPPFQIVFMDPPYAQGLEKEVLEFLSRTRPAWITPDTQIITEAAKENDFSYAAALGFSIAREKIYKTNKHVFLHLNGEAL